MTDETGVSGDPLPLVGGAAALVVWDVTPLQGGPVTREPMETTITPAWHLPARS